MEIRVLLPSAGEVAGLEGRQLDDALRVLDGVLGEVEAAIAAVMQRCRQSGAFLDDGFRTLASWAAAQCNWPIAEARGRSRLAAALTDLPAMAAGLADGRVGVAQAQEVARLHANLRIRAHVVAAEAELVEEAGAAPFGDFSRTCGRFADLVDGDGARQRHDAAHAARQASAGTVGEEFFLRAAGPAAAGEEIAEVLARFVDAEFHADCDTGRGEGDGDIPPASLPRSHRQRCFDALLAVFRAAATSRPGLAREPQVVIRADEHTYAEAFARFFDLGDLGSPPAVDVRSARRRFCETANGLPVDPLQAVAASLAGTLRRMLVDGSGRVIDYGRSRRLFTGAARAAVRASGRRCLWPGCDIPAGRCQIDHSRPWTATGGQPAGTTRPDNGGLLCAHHNRFKNRGYSTVRDSEGRWHTFRPDGSELAPRHRDNRDNRDHTNDGNAA